AENLGLPVLRPKTLRDVAAGLQPAHSTERRLKPAPTFIHQLKSLKPDLGIVVAYGKIIPDAVLNIFPKGVVNIHPSLLPKYRGPSPIQAALLNGDSETGVTIMLLDKEMDHGPILAQQRMKIENTPKTVITKHDAAALNSVRMTGLALSNKLADIGAQLLVEILPKYLDGEITPQPQDHGRATFTKILERENGQIDWKQSAEHIERMIRAYDLWPGTWTLWPAQISAPAPIRSDELQSGKSQKFQSGKRLKVIRGSLLHPTIGCATNSTPGYVWQTEDGQLATNCNPGSLILELLQIEGRKSMSGQDFLHGYPKFLGAILS
ncbi:MAG TPA: methionyl-tRNA formyltransferase, partial [Patescibacteria group bacterium]|nr:methionyl-tRNA formyltransferase [Patescibacteria group bacterium]